MVGDGGDLHARFASDARRWELATCTPVGRPRPSWFRRGVALDEVSLQLHTVRDLLAVDLDRSLEAIAAIGFTRVEHKGFAGRSARGFKAALDQAGLRATSGHVIVPLPFDQARWERAVDDAVVLGQEYIVSLASHTGPLPTTGDPAGMVSPRSLAQWQRHAEVLNHAGALARDAGLRFGFHNHFWEWLPLEDADSLSGFEVLLAETDPSLVHFELDLYWVRYAHRDPVSIMAAHGERIPQLHVKDISYANNTPRFADPGAGVLDFRRVFAAGEASVRREYIVERDDAGQGALNTARAGFSFLRQLRF